MKRLLSLSLCSLALLASPLTAHAQNAFLPNDTTLDTTNPVGPPYTAIVGYANFDDYINGVNATSPTIDIITGASVNQLETHNSSIINMSGGDIGSSNYQGKLLASDSSTINISGGNIVFDLDVQSTSTVNFSGGTVGDDIVTHDDTTVNMNGGTITYALLLNDRSAFNLRGGSLPDNVFVQDSSTLNIHGKNLSSVLTDPNFEDFYSEYTLSGSLQDGTNITGKVILVQNGSGARLTLTNGLSLTGNLTFEGIVASAPDQTISFTFHPSDGSATITRMVSVPASGMFSISGLPAKFYTVSIKGAKYLTSDVRVNMLNGDVTGQTARLRAGDVNNDNRVDIADFGILVNTFGSSVNVPDSGYDSLADFNGDGSVDIADFSLLVNNYGLRGDL